MSMDFGQDLIDEFVVEAREHLCVLEDELLTLEKEADHPDSDRVDRLFRAIHSIKGAAGFLGFQNVSSLSHVMETLLQLIREGEVRPESHYVDGLLEGTDLLGVLLDDVSKSNDIDISATHERIVDLLAKATSPEADAQMADISRCVDASGAPVGFNVDQFTLNSCPVDQRTLYVLKYDLGELQRGEGLTPATLVRRLLANGQILDAKLDISASSLTSDLSSQSLWYDVLYSTRFQEDEIAEPTGLARERITPVILESLSEENLVVDDAVPGETTVDELLEDPGETSADESESPQEATASAPSTSRSDDQPTTGQSKKSEHSDTVRIHVGILDQLMTLAGELVLVRNQQMLSLDRTDPVSRGISQRLDIVTSELQETIMRTRMQPIGNVFGKLPRIVRDLSKKLKKKIEIATSGDEVELDKTILESLADPLTHMIRNCCDHGIESPDVRKKAGKPEVGTITVRAYHEGGQINIEVRDDGGGLNAEAIRRKALQNGLKSEAELDGMREKDLHRLIMLPGFSTAKETTDVSGRGVGMDVVRTAIEQLGGSLDLESTQGKGTAINMRLPLTLAIIPCLVVGVGEHRYAIPQVNLEELVCLYDDDVRTKIECAGNQQVYRLRDHLLPMTRLNEVLDRPEPFTHQTRGEITETYRRLAEEQEDVGKSLTFAVVKIGSQRFGLIVDRVIGTEEIVVKPMHPALKSLPTYSGATVMGDGKVALILDIEGIARHAGIQFNVEQEVGAEQDFSDTYSGNETQAVLLFNNGQAEQFAVSLPLIRRIERIPADKIERVGEKEYVTIDGASTLILRLDSVLNVSPCEQQDEVFLLLPKHVERPFGILMSNVADIAETSADLDMTAYHEDGVLGTAIVRDRMTLFLDIFRLIERAEPNWFASRRSSSPAPERKCRILVAEDVPFFQQLIKGYLEADDYEVTVVDNGQQALDALAGRRFDLLISDIEMPVMGGLELIRRVRANMQYKDLPAIALTALASPEDRAKAIELGFNEYQVKINRETLLTIVSTVLGGKPSASADGAGQADGQAVLAQLSDMLGMLAARETGSETEANKQEVLQ